VGDHPTNAPTDNGWVFASSRSPSRTSLLVALAVVIVIAAGQARGAGRDTGSLSMGPQAMEGDPKVAPGTSLLAGYDFTIPGVHPAITVEFSGASVSFEATCANGSGGGTIMVAFADASYVDAQGSSAWYPSGDQHNPAVYQGATTVPDLCSGGLVRLQRGGTFTATVDSSDPSRKVNVRWHYSANGTSGSWSGTTSVTPAALSQGGGE